MRAMKNKKSAASSMILGVAFVWFTTHFGGGFASGAQIYSYYVRYGIWCLLMPVLAMGYNAVFFAIVFGLRENMRYMITGLIIMHFMGNLRRYFPICLKYCIFV